TVVLIAAAFAGAVAAQERRVPTQSELRLSYAPVVQHVAPAVVNVYAAKVVQNRNPLLDDPIFRRFFGVPGSGGNQLPRSLGSGVIVDASGLVVTNNHVIEGADEVKVSLSDKREFEATLVLKDPRTDLAVLRIKEGHEQFPVLDFADSDALQVGDVVLAIGNPFGVGQTVTHGIVSAVARTMVGISDYRFFIQTDAAINPGNSGGALVSMDGKLVGINTAIFSRDGGGSIGIGLAIPANMGRTLMPGGGTGEERGRSIGIGFAIPANMVRTVLPGVGTGEKLVRAWFGASGQNVTSDIASSMGLTRPVGVLLTDVYPGGPADRAGLKRGDVVLQL